MDTGSIATPVLAVGVVVVLVGAVTLLARFRAAVACLALMFFFSSLGVPGDALDAGRSNQWLAPLQENRSELFLITGGALLLTVFGHSHRVLGRPLGVVGLVLFLIACYAGLLRVIHDGPAAGVQSIVFASLTILPLLFVSAALTDDVEDARATVRGVMLANILWIAGIAVQYALDSGTLTEGRQDRFLGFFGNPQHAAAYLGLSGAIALWLLLDEDRGRQRMLWAGVVVANAVLLAWTGSRTGLGIFVIGAAAASYRRVGRTILLLPALAILAVIASYVVQALGIELGAAERLTSTENTRADSWATMIDAARQNPWIGVGIGETGKSENSYLYALSSFGIGALLLVIVLVAASGLLCLRLLRLRPLMDERHRSLSDLVIAFMGMYFAGAVLEGYLMARVSSTLVLFVLFAAIGRNLLVAVEEGTADARENEPWDEYGLHPAEHFDDGQDLRGFAAD